MIASDIIDRARRRLDDKVEPYAWDTTELVDYLNDSIDDFLDKTQMVRDDSTSSICSIELAANISKYNMDARIITITSARVGTFPPLSIYDAQDMDIKIYFWREVDMPSTDAPIIIIPDYESGKLVIYPFYNNEFEVIGSSNITFTAATSKITKTSGLSDLSLLAGDRFIITETVSNNGTYTVVAAGDTEITVSEVLTNESNTSAVLDKVLETLLLTVERRVITEISPSVLSVTPGVPSRYHRSLVYGITSRAYGKRDIETYDLKRQLDERALWQDAIDDAKENTILLRGGAGICTPHEGTL